MLSCRFIFIAALAATTFVGAVHAETRRQKAGDCDVWMPALEDRTLAWDYWWSGACAAGLASGAGFLVEYMQGGGFGDVYAVTMAAGRAKGEVTAYGSAFLGIEWDIRAGTMGEGDEWPDSWRQRDSQVPRFSLPRELQQALDRYAVRVGHRQMPRLPVMAHGERCRRSVEVDGQAIDVDAFLRAHGSYEQARQGALLQAMTAHEERRPDARASLALATAVIGCRDAR